MALSLVFVFETVMTVLAHVLLLHLVEPVRVQQRNGTRDAGT